MNSKSYKIDVEIYVVFIIVIGISVFNAIYSSYNITANQEVTGKIMSTDVPSLQKLEQMNLLVTRSKMYTTNWVYLQSNKEDKEKLRIIHSIEFPALKNAILSLAQKWSDKAEADSAASMIFQFEKLMIYEKQVMNTLVKFDDYEDPMKRFAAEEILENEVLPQSTRIIDNLNYIILQRKAKAEYRYADVNKSSRMMMYSVLGMAILIVLVILLAAFYISNHIIVPTMRLRNYVLQMGKGEIPEMNMKPGKNAIGQMSAAVNSLAQSLKKTANFAHTIGDGNFSANHEPLSPKDELGNALIQMRESLRRADEENRQRTWISTGIERINEIIRENNDDLNKLAEGLISTLARYINACQGGFYLVDENNSQIIRMHGMYAGNQRSAELNVIKRGEGLIGQAIKDGQIVCIENIQTPSIKLTTGVGDYPATTLLIVPLKIHGIVYGAVELNSFKPFEAFQIDFVKSIGQSIGSTIYSVRANTLTKKLLDETRLQAERLQMQEEQLIKTNEELSSQSKLLQQSEEELKASNRELKTNARELQHKNEVLEQAREALSIKAKELELNNKFKSEFLANMSHELRTPLNSVLILAKLLAEKESTNLTEKQIEYAKVIHKSGSDLLTLINDILDLSKIESGKIELVPEEIGIREITEDLRMLFEQVANEKSITYTIQIDDQLPEKFITDKLRLEQILKNLLSNAFKFTPIEGTVELSISPANRSMHFANPSLYHAPSLLCIAVKDSGIGIPPEKQGLIFEPFRQADGSTSRKFGGTGLGLSISKTLVALLGGEIQLESKAGEGSCFSIYIPLHTTAPSANVSHETNSQSSSTLTDDRDSIEKGDKVVIIAESDPVFAGMLMEHAKGKKFKTIVAKGKAEIFECAKNYSPEAILLDVVLNNVDGISILKEIKENKELNHIPVHMISKRMHGGLTGDVTGNGFLKKPLDKFDLDRAFSTIEFTKEDGLKRVLLVEDLNIHQEIIKNLLATHHKDVQLSIADSVKDAKKFLEEYKYDCIVLDLDLGNGVEEGYRFLKTIRETESTFKTPVIIFTAQELNRELQEIIDTLSSTYISKNIDSFGLLLDQTTEILKSDKPQTDPGIIITPTAHDQMLEGKFIMLVDDDMRNIYALTSLLEAEGVTILPAVNGRDAVNKASSSKVIPDLILMDIMMPEMDGYEAMRLIRKLEGFATVPIIAITAKAMHGDKEKCIQAGASDYISKPIVSEKLLSMMKLWLHKPNE